MRYAFLTLAFLYGTAAQARANEPAQVVVRVPADARLYVDDNSTTSTGTVRRLVTPPLDRDATYTYSLRAEVERNGETLTREKEVDFQGGERVVVRFDFPAQRSSPVGIEPAPYVPRSFQPDSYQRSRSFTPNPSGPSGFTPAFPPAPEGGRIVQRAEALGNGRMRIVEERVMPDGSRRVISSRTQGFNSGPNRYGPRRPQPGRSGPPRRPPQTWWRPFLD
jgi:uncharacterized protein (TIGR03000 family)